MNLRGKKQLAARALGVGAGKIIFVRVDEVKEAITKQDIRDMAASGAIAIKEARGRLKNIKLGKRKGMGKVKKKINHRKEKYVLLTRKLRKYVKQLLLQEKITKEQYYDFRKKIKSKNFRSKSHMKEVMTQEI
jgi:ribosomal protein L19E